MIVIAAGFFLVNKDNKFLVGHPTRHSSNFWSIPKGKVDDGEELLDAAIRETYEEANVNIIGEIRIHKLPEKRYQKTRKILHPFVLLEKENNIDFSKFELKCNSTVPAEDGGFPEMDVFKWIGLDEAVDLIHESQARCLDEIKELIYGKK